MWLHQTQTVTCRLLAYLASLILIASALHFYIYTGIAVSGKN
jgi:hypothetical protein